MPKNIFIFILFAFISSSYVVFSTYPKNETQLGELLFFDTILSENQTISCASCHKPQFAFADTMPFSIGIYNQKTERNTPSCMNMQARATFFYDGRAATLSQQIPFPIQNEKEMNLPLHIATKRLNNNTLYLSYFKKIYQHPPTDSLIIKAITQFINSLETSNSPFDEYLNGDSLAISAEAKRGQQIFMNKGKCFDCHFSPDLTGDEFRNIGLYNNSPPTQDPGRFEITHDSSDIGKFKTPSLRNVALTAPYMHNGMFKSLAQVIDYYNEPAKFVQNAHNTDTLLQKPLQLTTQEKADLEAFLLTLTDKRFLSKKTK